MRMKGRCGYPENPDLAKREPAKCSQGEMHANICQVLRILRQELKIYIYKISQNVKCLIVFLGTIMRTKINRPMIVIQSQATTLSPSSL